MNSLLVSDSRYGSNQEWVSIRIISPDMSDQRCPPPVRSRSLMTSVKFCRFPFFKMIIGRCVKVRWIRNLIVRTRKSNPKVTWFTIELLQLGKKSPPAIVGPKGTDLEIRRFKEMEIYQRWIPFRVWITERTRSQGSFFGFWSLPTLQSFEWIDEIITRNQRVAICFINWAFNLFLRTQFGPPKGPWFIMKWTISATQTASELLRGSEARVFQAASDPCLHLALYTPPVIIGPSRKPITSRKSVMWRISFCVQNHTIWACK